MTRLCWRRRVGVGCYEKLSKGCGTIQTIITGHKRTFYTIASNGHTTQTPISDMTSELSISRRGPSRDHQGVEVEKKSSLGTGQRD